MALSLARSPLRIHCQGLLFDMDGILFSSLGSVERSLTKWSHLRGLDPAEVLRTAHGCRMVDLVARLRPDLDAAAETCMEEQMEIEDTEGLLLLPGVRELLSALPAERWAVVTSATIPLARARIAAGGLPLPSRLITSESVAEGKPHPAPYRAGAALLGYRPEECVVFEDAPSGVAAGRAAGCTVVATTFSHSAGALAAAHYLVPDLSGVSVAVTTGGLELMLTAL